MSVICRSGQCKSRELAVADDLELELKEVTHSAFKFTGVVRCKYCGGVFHEEFLMAPVRAAEYLRDWIRGGGRG